MHVRNVEERNDFSKFEVYFLLRIYIYDFVYDDVTAYQINVIYILSFFIICRMKE